MGQCEALEKKADELAVLDAAALPPWATEHLASCPTCVRAMTRARLARGLLAMAVEAHEPPEGFARRVLAALPATAWPRPAEPDLWRLGWRLIPAFAATAALVLAVFQFEARVEPTSAAMDPSLIPVEALSAGERIVMEASTPEPDLVLAAVMEGSG